MISQEEFYENFPTDKDKWEAFDEMQTQYDGLWMTYLSQVSLLKSQIEELKNK